MCYSFSVLFFIPGASRGPTSIYIIHSLDFESRPRASSKRKPSLERWCTRIPVSDTCLALRKEHSWWHFFSLCVERDCKMRQYGYAKNFRSMPHVLKYDVQRIRHLPNFSIFAVYRKLADSVSFCVRKVDFPAHDISRQDHLKSKNQKDFVSRWLCLVLERRILKKKNLIKNFWRTFQVKITIFVPKNRPFYFCKRVVIIIFLNPLFTHKLNMYEICLESFKRIGVLVFEKSCRPTLKM